MIRSRGEYLFVTVPETIRVDGGIMPARDVAGDGSWKHLRGEDPAFLLEGVLERNEVAPLNHGVSVSTEMDRALRADRLAFVAAALREWATNVNEPYFVKPMEGEAFHGTQSVGFDAFFPSARFADEDLASSEDDFAAGSPLKADAVRALFYDMQRLRSFIASATVETNGTSWEIVKSAYNEDHAFYPPTAPSNYVYLYQMEMQTDGEAPVGGSYSMECRLSDGSFSSAINTEPTSTASLSLAASCKTYAVFFVRYTLRKPGTSEGKVDEASYSCVHVACTVEGGVAKVAAADIMAAADSIIGHHGWKKVGWNQMEYSVQSIEIFISDIYAVWTLGDHTDISPLGWNWTP